MHDRHQHGDDDDDDDTGDHRHGHHAPHDKRGACDDIHHHELYHRFGMIQGQPPCDPRTPVMGDKGEGLVYKELRTTSFEVWQSASVAA